MSLSKHIRERASEFDEQWPSVRSYTAGRLQDFNLQSERLLIEEIILKAEGMKEPEQNDNKYSTVNILALAQNKKLSDLISYLKNERDLLEKE